MAITISGNGISSDAIASLAASKLTGQVPDANAPSGSVIQVVNALANSPVTIATTTYTDIGLSASITPVSTSSKVFVLVRVPFNTVRGGSITNAWASIRLLRNGSAIEPIPGSTYEQGINYGDTVWGDFRSIAILQSLDSPSSTSSVTYSVQAARDSSNSSIIVQETGYYKSSITLMEIAG